MNIFALKCKAKCQTIVAHFLPSFNRHIKGIKTKFNISYIDDKQSGHKLDVMYHKNQHTYPCVIYFHGGGWMTFDKSIFRSTCKRIADQGAVVFNCNHRLSPKYSIPEMEDDVLSAIVYVRKNARLYNGNPDQIILMGDSSGGHLVSLVINKLSNNYYENCDYFQFIKGSVIFYGAFDLVALTSTDFKNSKTYLKGIISENQSDYLEILKEYSPTNYVNNNLPPILLCSGEIDSLHEKQSLAYFNLLSEHNIKVFSLFFDEKVKMANHRFITFDQNPISKIAFQRVGAFMKEILEK